VKGESDEGDALIRLQGLSRNGGLLGPFDAETEDEIWRHIELHASVAHGEDPAAWTADDRAHLKTLIKTQKDESPSA
jgi:hypothetical protein